MMLNASDSSVLAMFHKVHGDLGRHFNAEIITDDGCNTVAVGCFQGDELMWQASLAELLVDLYISDNKL